MSLSKQLSGAGILMMIAGCASSTTTMKDIKIRTESDPSVRFPGEGTFSWALRSGDISKEFKGDAQAVGWRIRDTLEREFARRGFEYRGGDTRWISLVYYRIVTEDELDAASLAKESGEKGGQPSATGGKFVKGSLIIDVLEPKTYRLMWRGIAEMQIDAVSEIGEQEKVKKTNEAVQKILEKFPPRR